MQKLSKTEKKILISQIENGEPIDERFKDILFDNKKEYELIYEDKEREVDILAETFAVPFQKVKTFKNGKQEDDKKWYNMLIFGDNLQTLKTLLQMKENGLLKNEDGTDGIRLIYIDPPFATKQEFKGSQDQKAYQDKVAGARFLEFLRKRLIFLRELLADNGSIYVHLDQKRAHYIKVILDEIFGENFFKNDIAWCYKEREMPIQQWNKKHDLLLFYTKSDQNIFNWENVTEPYSDYTITNKFKHKEGNRYYRLRYKDGRNDPPEESEDTYRQYADKGVAPRDWWEISILNQSSTERVDYPTQKPEKLLTKIVSASSNSGDLVLDCFAGSGTTLSVAEKLNRRWIGVDCGKLSIYTIQKRLLNIKDSKDLEKEKKTYGKECKPFTLHNAGLYDYKKIKNLSWEKYRDFALKLFQCRDENHKISKIELDGYLGSDSVLVFNYQKHLNAVMDKGFIDDLHKYLGDKIGKTMYIVAPAASVKFLEDYVQIGKTRYYILRIPYSIIEDIHKRDFTKLTQPISEGDVNDTIDSVGFDFIQTPIIECEYKLVKPTKLNLFTGKNKECVIKIKKFESKVLSKKPIKEIKLDSLSMVMLDYNFNGEVFDLDDVFYAENIKANNYEIRFDSGKVKNEIMIIYVDIYGNEKRETKEIKNFK